MGDLMIKELNIKFLKSIDDLSIKCKNLNIITGVNSSGKSTVLQSILLAYQTFFHESISERKITSLNGELISLGDFRENKNIYTRSDKISIGLKFDNKKNLKIDFIESDEYSCDVNITPSTKNKGIDEVFNIKYLSCNRIGSQDVYKKDYSHNGIGINGEYALDYLERHKTDPLEKELIRDESSDTLISQVNYWLSRIINATITTENITGTDVVKVEYKIGDGRPSRPKNVGSGISYLISIIILCLSSSKGDILLIENPEIHLHPRAQSMVCQFLNYIANSGRQLFVETHSDHIFNGIRAGIATNEITNEKAGVFFLYIDGGCTKANEVQFGKNGRIVNYRKDLFDQFDLDLNKMLGL